MTDAERNLLLTVARTLRSRMLPSYLSVTDWNALDAALAPFERKPKPVPKVKPAPDPRDAEIERLTKESAAHKANADAVYFKLQKEIECLKAALRAREDGK